MNAIDYFMLGLRNIWRRKSRSFLTIFAVVIGAISMVIMLSLVLGAQQVATRQLESIDGLTLISVSGNPELQSNGNILNTDTGDDDAGTRLNDTSVQALRALPGVVDAAPIVGVWVKSASLEGQEKKFRAGITAYDPASKVLKMPVGAGRPLQQGDLDAIVIGGELLREFGYANRPQEIIGKRVVLYTQEYVDWGPEPPKPPDGAGKEYWDAMQKQPHGATAVIVGVVTSGMDEGQNYITLDWGRRLMTIRNWEYDDTNKLALEQARKRIEDQLNRDFESRKQTLFEQAKQQNDEGQMRAAEEQMRNEMDAELSRRLAAAGFNESDQLILRKYDGLARNGYSSILVRVDSTEHIETVANDIRKLGFGVSTAKEMLDQIKRIFWLVGLIIGAIGGIVLFVAALGIINSTLMATYERTREIGILRACGATRSNIRNMFIIEAATLGFIGGAIGLALSFGLAKVLNMVGNAIASSNGLPIKDIISFRPWLIIGVLLLTTAIGIVSGLLPAIRASRLDPVEALRYE